MAIDLLNSFLQRNQKINSNSQGNVSSSGQTNGEGKILPQNLQVMQAIRALKAGQTIQGEIVAIKGKDVQLSILKDVIIEAKIAGSMNLTPGVVMPFQVKANNSQGLSLIPLFTNIAADPNILKALDMAQIPVNDRSLEMVQTLMEKGMPIDKQSVQQMYREVVNYKDVPVKDLVTLRQMELPINRENVTQLSCYQNNKHYLKDTLGEIGSTIGEQLESLVAQGKTEAALKVVHELQQIFPKIQAEGQEEDTGNQEKLPPEIRQEVVAGQTQAEGNVRTPHAIPEETVSSQKETVAIPEETVATPKETVPIPKETVPTQEENMGERVKQETGELQPGKTGETIDWKALTETILKEKTPGKISHLFEKIWDKEMARNWLLEPEMVADKKNIKEFYDKLSHQMKQLEKIFEDGSLGKSPVMKAVQNTVSNLDFMNQLNQMHAYIQLPLKMANQNAHGELYVFTNKKNLTKQEGKVTALLHLDMEHLGKMDVYVALENKKVNTNFYLEKEEYLEFLEEHMDLLTSRLNQRGYTCEVKTTLRNEEPEPMMKIIEKQQGTSMMMSMQAFDVRA